MGTRGIATPERERGGAHIKIGGRCVRGQGWVRARGSFHVIRPNQRYPSVPHIERIFCFFGLVGSGPFD